MDILVVSLLDKAWVGVGQDRTGLGHSLWLGLGLGQGKHATVRVA